jgi:hypothetical protein
MVAPLLLCNITFSQVVEGSRLVKVTKDEHDKPISVLDIVAHSVNKKDIYKVSRAYYYGDVTYMTTGAVISITKDSIKIKEVIDDEETSYKIDSDTKFLQDKVIAPRDPKLGQGKQISFKDIRKGEKVTVILKESGKGILLEIIKGGALASLD